MDHNLSQDFIHGRIGTPVKRLDAVEKAGVMQNILLIWISALYCLAV